MAFLHPAAEHDHARAAREMPVQSVMVGARQDVGPVERLVLRLRAGTTFDHGVAAEFARDDDERPVEESARLEVADEPRDRTVDLRMELRHGLVALAMRVPLEERHVFGRDLDEAGAVLDEPAGEQAAAAEAPGVVGLLDFLRLQGDVEGGPLLRAEETVGVVHRTQHRLLLVVAEQVAVRTGVDEPAESAVAVHEAAGVHPLGRPDGGGGFFRERQVHRTELAAEEPRGGESLQLLAFADPFEPLADVDERRHDRITRPQHARHPGADMRAGHGLRRDVAGVPVELVTRMQDAAEVRLHGGTDQRPAVHDLGDALESLADPHPVDGRRDRGERAEHPVVRHALLIRRIALGIEGLRGGHAARQPDEDAGVGRGGGRDDLLVREQARGAHRERRGAGQREPAEELAAGDRLRQGEVEGKRSAHDQRMVWNSGSMHTAQSRSAMPCSERSGPSRPTATDSSAADGGRLRAER